MSAAHIRHERIIEYLHDLDRQLSDIEQLPIPNANFLTNKANFERTKAIKLSLACAIQDVTRVSLHIATALGLGSVRSSESETIKTLSDAGVISANLTNKIVGMPAFRNRLIHDYLPNKFDAQRLYENLNHLNDFREFAAEILGWMEAN